MERDAKANAVKRGQSTRELIHLHLVHSVRPFPFSPSLEYNSANTDSERIKREREREC